jgi:hypothetical protein
MKLVVYTAITKDYDVLRPPRRRCAGVDYVCFTEPGKAVAAGWTRRDLPALDVSPQSANRFVKFHPHRWFPQHDASVYVDGNIELLGDVAELAARALERASIAFYDHPVRTSASEEALECALVGFDSGAAIRRQMRRYHDEGFNGGSGLLEANIIVRRHHDPAVIRAMDRWWSEWEHGVKRDQLSLMYVLWREQPAVMRLGRHDGRFAQQYFAYHPHPHKLGRAPRLLRQILNRLDLLVYGMSVKPVG